MSKSIVIKFLSNNKDELDSGEFGCTGGNGDDDELDELDDELLDDDELDDNAI